MCLKRKARSNAKGDNASLVVRKINATFLLAVNGLLFLLFSMLGHCTAQGPALVRNALQSETPLAMTPGAPAGSYALSGFDNVNLYNGNLNFSLPLLKIGGR